MLVVGHARNYRPKSGPEAMSLLEFQAQWEQVFFNKTVPGLMKFVVSDYSQRRFPESQIPQIPLIEAFCSLKCALILYLVTFFYNAEI